MEQALWRNWKKKSDYMSYILHYGKYEWHTSCHEHDLQFGKKEKKNKIK